MEEGPSLGQVLFVDVCCIVYATNSCFDDFIRGKTSCGESSFEGQYREGNREGNGSLRITTQPSPITFFGMFDLSGAVGRGVFTRTGASSATFESEYKAGAAEGAGLLKIGRVTYKGTFSEGKMSGKGTWTDGTSM